MDRTKDYYGILGVLPGAEEIVIRAAYKALAQRYHPDRFGGSKEEAHGRMTELNEAYSVLSDSQKRAEYDKQRGTGTHSGDSYFDESRSSAPFGVDPLERDWTVALKYYPDLRDLEARLSKISWKLSSSFRAYLLEAKTFETRQHVAETMEQQFLEAYFGSDKRIIRFAQVLIKDGNRAAARALNEAIRVLGSKIEPQRVIEQIQQEFKLGDGVHLHADSHSGFIAVARKLRRVGIPDADIRHQLRSRGLTGDAIADVMKRI